MSDRSVSFDEPLWSVIAYSFDNNKILGRFAVNADTEEGALNIAMRYLTEDGLVGSVSFFETARLEMLNGTSES